MIFEMSYYHHYSISDLENLSVFELELFRDMIAADLAKKAEEAEKWAVA